MSTASDIVAQIVSKNRERLKLQRQVDKLDEEGKALQAQLTALNVKSGEYDGILVTVKVKPVPKADDWAKVWAYVREHNAFDLLHKRLTETAVMARFEAGEPIPGITTDDKTTYKFTEA